MKQVTTPLQVVADDDTQEVQLLNLYPDIRSRAAEPNGTMHAGHTAHQGQPYCL